jgi:hypothetical protein
MVLFLASGDAATKDLSQKQKQDVSSDLQKPGVPQSVIDKVLDGKTVSEAEVNNLTERQKEAIRNSQAKMTGGGIVVVFTWLTAIMVRATSIYVGCFSLVGVLLGWLMIRKKQHPSSSAALGSKDGRFQPTR